MKKSDLGILVVDDELIVRDSLTKWFREDGFRVDAAGDAPAALKKLRDGSWNLVLADIRMPGMDGLELMQRVKAIDPGIVVIIVTAYATVDTAVRALKQGAYDYVTKPIDPDYLNHIVINALEQQLLMQENQRLRNAVSELTAGDEIVGESPEMRRVLELITVVAQTDTNVMIKGEVGTGKELVARTIHQRSTRRFLPLVTVNCGAMTETMLLEELFGDHAEDSHGTPAAQQGKIGQADGGTLFLDEVGCLDASAQGELLRILETRLPGRTGGDGRASGKFQAYLRDEGRSGERPSVKNGSATICISGSPSLTSIFRPCGPAAGISPNWLISFWTNTAGR